MSKSKIKLSAAAKEWVSEKMGWDATALPEYIDEQSPDFITTLIQSSNFLEKLQLEEGVKGKRKIKLLNADMTLQTMSGCTPAPDGSVVFTDRTLEVEKLYAGIEFCNEDLNGKYTQLLNKIGVQAQDNDLPLEDVLLAYLGKLVKRKAQRVVVLGDTTSLDTELALFDGLKKQIDEDALVNIAYSTETAWDDTNGFDILKTVYDEIPPEVFDDELNVVILTGRFEARRAVNQVWNDKDFNAKIETTDTDGQLSFELPTTDIRVETIPELNNTGCAYGFIYDYAYVGTDAVSDMDDLAIKFDDYDNKLKVEGSFRLGTRFIQPQYWVRLRLTPTS